MSRGLGDVYKRQRLYYASMECRAQVALYGHTHRPQIDLERGMYLINPGAVCDRFGGGVAYADIRVADNGGVRVSLCKWE